MGRRTVSQINCIQLINKGNGDDSIIHFVKNQVLCIGHHVFQASMTWKKFIGLWWYFSTFHEKQFAFSRAYLSNKILCTDYLLKYAPRPINFKMTKRNLAHSCCYNVADNRQHRTKCQKCISYCWICGYPQFSPAIVVWWLHSKRNNLAAKSLFAAQVHFHRQLVCHQIAMIIWFGT